MFIDTHAHLNFKGFKDDFDEVFKASLNANVDMMVNVGSNYQTSLKAVEMIDYPSTRMKSGGEVIKSSRLRSNHKLFATVGLHPIHLTQDVTDTCMIDGKEYKSVSRQEKFDYKKYQDLAKNKGVVAIGETGLDYFHNNEGSKFEILNSKSEINNKFKIQNIKQIQKEVFREHIGLAQELEKPLMLHCRGSKEEPDGAYDEMIEILEHERHPERSEGSKTNRDSSPSVQNDNRLRGVMHCFVGTLAQAKQFIDLGFLIGVNGIVTFKNSTRLQEIVRELPLDSLVLETDCPFLAPDPYRGKRNEPKYIPIIAQKIAEIKNISLDEVEKQTTKNAKKVFGI